MKLPCKCCGIEWTTLDEWFRHTHPWHKDVGVIPPEPETYEVSPYGLNDQFGLPDHNSGECGDE